MSVLDIGSACTLCHLVDFLPLACPHCHAVFCNDHIVAASHSCPEAGRPPESRPLGQLGYLEKCHYGPCVKATMESVAGVEGEGKQGDIARQVRCARCAGSFCVEHRHQDAHECAGPRAYNARQDAAQERKRRAAEVMATHFPGQQRRVLPKPQSHTRDLKHVGPAPEARLPPSVQAEMDKESKSASPPRAAKTKAYKLYEIHVRKIKMGAKPAVAGLSLTEADDKTFFEVATKAAGMAAVDEYMAEGTTVAREKVWVPSTMPVGKLYDTLVARARVGGENAKLFALCTPPDAPRQAVELTDLSQPAWTVGDGSLVLLVV